MKDRGRVALFIGVVCLAVVSVPAYGHHGTGVAYDNTKPTVLKGTVTDFEWKNPHAQLFLDVKDTGGNLLKWAVEMNSPGVLQRNEGWTRKTIKAGDEVTVTMFPSKAGTPVGVVSKIVLNGKVILENRGGQQQ